MKNSRYHALLLLKRIGLMVLIYTLCRALFYAFNHQYFSETDLLWVFIGGLRFDLAALAIINSPFIMLSLLPLRWIQKRAYQRFLLVFFALINALPLLFNLIDIEYFKFTSKRSTADVFDLLFLSNDVWTLLPDYLRDYWHLLLLFILTGAYFIRVLMRMKLDGISAHPFHYLWQGLTLILMVALFTVCSRGGLQLRPINNLNAIEYGRPSDTPLILNSPFSIIKTAGKRSLKRKNYYTDEEVENRYPALKQYGLRTDSTELQKNVIILIMESFSMDFVGKKNEQGLAYTPFLNELRDKSFIDIEQGYANGRKSIEAMPAIIAGLPSLMNDPFITSRFNGTRLNSLPQILGQNGYSSAFFHGGNKGTMGFDAFAKSAGFDQAYWSEDYPDQDEHDGTWGIYDGPFFQFAAESISQMKEPYFASIFSLSSHHPYSLPTEVQGQYEDFEAGLARTIRYADDALKHFFETLEATGHMDDMLFVITADHTPNSFSAASKTALGVYAVPMIFYAPSYSEKKHTRRVAQHMDIMPTVIDLLNLDSPFISLGQSLIQDDQAWAVQHINELYQITDGQFFITFDGEQIRSAETHSGQALNIGNEELLVLEKRLKAVIQQYTNRLVDNQFSIRNTMTDE